MWAMWFWFTLSAGICIVTATVQNSISLYMPSTGQPSAFWCQVQQRLQMVFIMFLDERRITWEHVKQAVIIIQEYNLHSQNISNI